MGIPIGDGTYFNPIEIGAPANNTDQLRAEYIRNSPDILYSLLNRVISIANANTIEYWQLYRKFGNSAVPVVLKFNSSGLVNSLPELFVVKYDDKDAEWKNEGNGGPTRNTTLVTVTSTKAISHFGPFTLGSKRKP